MKPHIICHMISSIDGRLQIERYSKLHDNDNPNLVLDTYLHLGNQIEANAWIIGSGTALSMGLNKITRSDTDLPAQNLSTYIANKTSERYCVIFDSKGTLQYTSNTFENDNIIVVLGESASENYLTFLKEIGVSYLFAGKSGKDIHLAMSILYANFGIHTALLEGGGVLNGNFLQAGVIDELSVLLYPGIDGLSGINSIFEYRGNETDMPSKGQSLSLKEVKKLEADQIWLRYNVHRES